MLASGGYNWTVVSVECRKEYMKALEKASVEEVSPILQNYLLPFKKIAFCMVYKSYFLSSYLHVQHFCYILPTDSFLNQPDAFI